MSTEEDAFAQLVTYTVTDPAVLRDTVLASRIASRELASLPEDETPRHTRELLCGIRDALVGSGEPGPELLAAAERLGSDRARQGVPLTAVLDGFQAARSQQLATVITEGRRRGVQDDVMLDGFKKIDHITTAVIHRMVRAHRVAELEMARTTREAHTQTLRQLVRGEGDVSVGHPLDASTGYYCLVSDISDPTVAGVLEKTFASSGPGLSGFVDGRLTALLPRAPVVAADAALLVITPPTALAEIPRVYTLARRALEAAKAVRLSGLHNLTDLALLTATSEEPELGRLLRDHLVGRLDPDDSFHRELAATALAYLDNGSRTEQTALALHVHGNTVKYRLRRLRDLVGTSPADVDTLTEATHWWWALHAWLND
jgi:hypothetical protein